MFKTIGTYNGSVTVYLVRLCKLSVDWLKVIAAYEVIGSSSYIIVYRLNEHDNISPFPTITPNWGGGVRP